MGRMSADGHHGSMRPAGKGRWYLYVKRGVRRVKRLDFEATGNDGTPRGYYEVFEGTAEEAQRRRDEIWESMATDVNLGDRMTIGDYWERVFVDEHLVRRSAKTRKAYESYFSRYVLPAFGHRWPPDIRHRELQALVDSVAGPASQRTLVRYLRAFLGYMRADLDIREPMAIDGRIEYSPLQARRKETWSAEDLREAMVALEGNRIERLFLVMAGGGLRREEAIPLVVPDDLRFAADEAGSLVAEVRIWRTFTDEDRLRELTKTRAERYVVIPEPFSSRLLELMPDQSEPLFPSTLREKSPDEVDDRYFDGCTLPTMTPSAVSAYWAKLFRPEGTYKIRSKEHVRPAGPLASLPKIELESLRHTHVTLAHEGGAPMHLSALAHGHSEQVQYGHYLGTGQASRVVADAVSKVMRGRLETPRRDSDYRL